MGTHANGGRMEKKGLLFRYENWKEMAKEKFRKEGQINFNILI